MCQTVLACSELNNRLPKENMKTGKKGTDSEFEIGSPKSKRHLQGMCVRATGNVQYMA